MTWSSYKTAAWIPLMLIALSMVVSIVWGKNIWQPNNAQAVTVDISGQITPIIFLDTSACASDSGNIGDMIPGDPFKTAADNTGKNCKLSFGSSNSNTGATLSLFEDPAANGAGLDAMRCVTADTCASSSMSDTTSNSHPAAGSSSFGALVLNHGGQASAKVPHAPAVFAMNDNPTEACETSGTGTGSCSITWGASASSSNPVGSYQARVRAAVYAK